MFFVDRFIFFGSLLVLLGVLCWKFSARYGMPSLLLFMLLGMLAGTEGIGRIDFEDYKIAHGVGTLALVVILYSGGLHTSMASLRLGWKPAVLLAAPGLLLTAGVTGLAAAWILGIPPLQGLLLGSIVASTDAAAVFTALRSQSIGLDPRLGATLEVESGSNDPMAVFLTIGLIEVILGERSLGLGMLSFFLLQIGVGAAAGYVLGRLATALTNWSNLGNAGLYPILVLALGLITYGLTVAVGGSGFLAVYIAGIIVGNGKLVFKRGVMFFHDGLAWVSQIIMFVMLGLLSYPSRLMAVAWEGALVALVLMLAARPAAVALSLWPFRFNLREHALVAWVGLKGAVPIILSIFPFLFGLPDALLYFNVVFFVVLFSMLIQGWPLPAVARLLGLTQTPQEQPPAILQISALHHIDADVVDYLIEERSAVAHLRISELELPDEVVVAMLTRQNEIVPARGPTVLLPGDHAFLILKPEARARVDAIFRMLTTPQEAPLRTGILLPPGLTLGALAALYGVEMDGPPDESLQAFLGRTLGQDLVEGLFYEREGWRLYVHSVPEEGPVIGLEEAAS